MTECAFCGWVGFTHDGCPVCGNEVVGLSSPWIVVRDNGTSQNGSVPKWAVIEREGGQVITRGVERYADAVDYLQTLIMASVA